MMSRGIVATALDFFGFGEDLNGDEIDLEADVDIYGTHQEASADGGVYPLRAERSEFSGMAIIRARPETIDEAPQVAEQIKDHLPVIINLEDVPDNEARRIVDFLGGVVYGLNGSMKKVARSVFICSPFDVPVEMLSISAGRGGPVPHEDDEAADLRSRSSH